MRPIILPDGEQLPETDLGHDNGSLGPSDTSDSGSDVPAYMRDSDSDSQGTGDRASVNPRDSDDPAEDVEPDRTVGEDEAGLAHTRPDPARNGG
jgi:hypothetical protein